MPLFAEKSGKSQGAEGQRIIHQKLPGRVKYGIQDKLEQAVCKAGEKPCFCAVPVADEHDEQHAEQGDGAAEGKSCEFDLRGHDGKSHGHAGEDKLLRGGSDCPLFFGAEQNGCGNQGQKQRRHGDDSRGSQPEDILFIAVDGWKGKKI